MVRVSLLMLLQVNGWSVACSELSLFRAWLGTIERRYRCSVTSSLSLLCASLPPVHYLPSGVNHTSVQGPYIQICTLYIHSPKGLLGTPVPFLINAII